jgi:hypothetical protein
MSHLLLQTSSSDIEALIADSEQHKIRIWTTWRLVKQLGAAEQLSTLPTVERQAILRHIKGLLRQLQDRGVLRRRSNVKRTGFGREVGYDYIPSHRPRPPLCPRCEQALLDIVGGYLWDGLLESGYADYYLCRGCSAQLRREGPIWSDASPDEWERNVTRR